MSTAITTAQEKMAHIRQLLAEGQAEKALQFIEKTSGPARELKNAQGVCLMRLGRVTPANDVLRELVFQNSMCIPLDTPPLFQANYATALLLKNYNQMAIEIVKGLPEGAHPYVDRLSAAIAQWRKALPLVQRLRCVLGLYPSRPVVLPFPPGEV